MTQLFPKWTNHLPTAATALAAVGAPVLVLFVWYYFSPKFTDVGYAPDQPVPYSHKLHAGLLGMDCRYCHQNVERSPHASIPSTNTCANCHSQIKTDSLILQPVYQTYTDIVAGKETETKPIPWVKVHLLPDHAYFDHSAHVNIGGGQAGVGCISCHGRVDQMEVVRQAEPLSMGWCLECHRSPEKHVRPQSEITNMNYEHSVEKALQLIKENNIKPPTHCSACHR